MMRDGGGYQYSIVRCDSGSSITQIPVIARSRPDQFKRLIAVGTTGLPFKIANPHGQPEAERMLGWQVNVSIASRMSDCFTFRPCDRRDWRINRAATLARWPTLRGRNVTGPRAIMRTRISIGSSTPQNERVFEMQGFFETGSVAVTPVHYWCAVLTCCFTLAGCDGGATVGSITPEEQQALIQSASTAAPNLQPGDKIKVTVFGEDRLSGEYEIDSAGYVSLPLAGTVKAAGLSKLQMEQSLARKFSGEYLRDPKVTVDIGSFRPFYIMGEVDKPGEYLFKNGLNVLSAIALAGGSTYRASRGSVQIQHVGEADFKSYPMSPTIPVLPGDLIRIPERYF